MYGNRFKADRIIVFTTQLYFYAAVFLGASQNRPQNTFPGVSLFPRVAQYGYGLASFLASVTPRS